MAHFPVFEKEAEGVSVVVYGRQESLSEKNPSIMTRIKRLRGDPMKTCLVLQAEGLGVYLPQMPNYQTPIKAGGVKLIEPGSVAIIQSQDAPIVILRDGNTGNIVVCRAGRYSLVAPQSDCALCPPEAIIEHSVHMLAGHASKQNIQALVVAGISGEFFKHERRGAEELVAPFDRFGKDVFINRKLGSLDLFRVITAQLKALEIPEENISRADHCTFLHPRLASYRLGHQQVNTVVVIRTS